MTTDPSTPAPRAYGRLATDAFCRTCHYNLHGLDVTLDPTLKLPVVRCPECGTYNAAGQAATHHSIWQARMAATLVIVLVGFILIMLAVNLIMTGITFAAGLEMFLHYSYQSSGSHYYVRAPDTLAHWTSVPLYGLWVTFLGYGLGQFTTVFCAGSVWRRIPWLIWPIALLVVSLPPVFSISFYPNAWELSLALAYLAPFMALYLSACALGLLLGRPLMRFALRCILSPKLLQQLRTLWTCDNKIPPPPR
jgi:hypothetical protein